MEPPPLVLLTDDDADTREMYLLSLSLCGLQVEVACDGVEAWEKTQALLPDIVVTDLALPRLDGYDLCHRIREDPHTAKIPVIAVTGWAGKVIDERVRDAGFKASLLKPVLPDVLIGEIRKAIADARALRAKSESVRSRVPKLLTESGRLLTKSEALRTMIEKKK